MTSVTQQKVAEITTSQILSSEEKIEKLTQIREDCRAAQRAATEGGMDAPDDLQTDLQEVDVALEKLGHTDTADEENAATL